jgi:N6-L-threonylcarbamoyladenine synthase
MNILGIESSCDETAAAVVSLPMRVRSSVVASQIESHRVHGGVVPELAARSHLDALQPVISAAVEESGLGWEEIDAVAVTQGPGLSSSLLMGMGAARALSARLCVPLIPVHHMEGHLLSFFLSPGAPPAEAVCPMLVLLVTGGHTALIRMDGPGMYSVLGRSIDDAAGEALDKGARLLGLSYPGGPEIERLALEGHADAVPFPKGLPDSEAACQRGGALPFSFSGLKTALRYYVEANPDTPRADVAASYQSAVMGALAARTDQALKQEKGIRGVACVGGVAKNRYLRRALEEVTRQHGVSLHTVPMEYCTDNAAMIAVVPLLRGLEQAESAPAVHPNLQLQGLVLR